jgi:hypothetical protein
MSKKILIQTLTIFLFIISYQAVGAQTGYKNFSAALYVRAFELKQMNDEEWLKTHFGLIEKQLKIDKVYFEVHRDLEFADKEVVQKVIKYFKAKGIKTSAGLALVKKEDDNFHTFCYSSPNDRAQILDIIKFAATYFDELILDDFFFTNCKCELCIDKKGSQSWSEYRLGLLGNFSKEIVAMAKKVNPKVNMIIKYPNWYDHYHFTGYNLETEPQIFDMIYTGSETRDDQYTPQHLPTYQSYSIMRYLENVKPGKNGGGWVDPYARRTLDRYIEQLQFTLYSKPKEIILFCSFDLVKYIKKENGEMVPVSSTAPLASYTLDKTDNFLDKLGNPIGITAYRPYHSYGEDYLHSYLGMIGLPIEMTPNFPTDKNNMLLTEHAKFDPEIVPKIKKQLIDGKNVVITSGLLRALQDKGIKDIVDITYTSKKAFVNQFSDFNNINYSTSEMVIPIIDYPTNDCWELLTAYDGRTGYPLLMEASYGKAKLYILTIPDNYSDLYAYPKEALTQIRKLLSPHLPVYIDAPGNVCLFTYSNNTFIVQSLLPNNLVFKAIIDKKVSEIIDLETGESIKGVFDGKSTRFEIALTPYLAPGRVFTIKD